MLQSRFKENIHPNQLRPEPVRAPSIEALSGDGIEMEAKSLCTKEQELMRKAKELENEMR